MPIYDYQCEDCKHSFETFQTMTEKNLTECPRCGGKLTKLISPPNIVFKGEGFYVNDYGKKEAKRKEEERKEEAKATPIE